jgi:hypothetical protein
MKQILIMVVMIWISGCQYFGIRHQEADSKEQIVRQEQDQFLQQIELNLEDGINENTRQSLIEFIEKNPESVFYQRAQLALAKVYEIEGDWSKAQQTYRSVNLDTRNSSSAIFGLSSFGLAKCHSQSGDFARVLASLSDAEKNSDGLSDQIKLVEIPALKAKVFYQIGQIEDAKENLNLAHAGVIRIRSSLTTLKQKEWAARVYFSMGKIDDSDLLEGNLAAFIEQIGVLQVFNLFSLEEEVLPWSEGADKQLRESYLKAWRGIKNLKAEDLKESHHFATRVDKDLVIQEEKIMLIDRLFEKITEIKSLKLPTESARSRAAKDFFDFLDNLKRDMQAHLQKLSVRNPLTPDTQKPRGL